MNNSRNNRAKALMVIVVCTLSILSTSFVDAQESSVPINIQVAIFKKIFTFDNKLNTGSPITVLVLYTDASKGAKDEIVSAFQQAGFRASAVRMDEVAGKIGETTVVYMSAGTGSAQSFCAKSGVLSISGVTSYAETGVISVGISTEAGKPKIFVAMGKLKMEGHEISADLLKLARVTP